MTVQTTNVTSGPYVGNNIADTFDYDFRIENKTQLKVFETNTDGITTLLTVDVDYTVAGTGNNSGGTITRVAGPLPTDYEWYIRSDYKLNQLTAFASQGGFFPQVHESAFDKITFLLQQLNDVIGRSFRLSESFSGNVDTSIPLPTAGAYIRWNDEGTGLINDDDITVVINITGAISTVADAAAEVVIVANNIGDVNIVADAVANMNIVADAVANMNIVAGSIDNVNIVGGSITNVNLVGNSITNVNLVGGDIANVNTVAGSITNMNTVAGSIDNVNLVGDDIANVNSVAGALVNLTTVANSIDNVNLVGNDIANVNIVANIAADVSNVSDNMATVVDAAGSLTAIQTAMLQMATAYTDSQTRYINAFAFS